MICLVHTFILGFPFTKSSLRGIWVRTNDVRACGHSGPKVVVELLCAKGGVLTKFIMYWVDIQGTKKN